MLDANQLAIPQSLSNLANPPLARESAPDMRPSASVPSLQKNSRIEARRQTVMAADSAAPRQDILSQDILSLRLNPRAPRDTNDSTELLPVASASDSRFLCVSRMR